jgi:hypothetical protein
MKNKEIPKYEYYLLTWGGFYNKEHKHNYKSGDYWFDSLEDRTKYIEELKKVSERLNAHSLVTSLGEGFTMRIKTIGNRIFKDTEGKLHHTTRDFGYNYDISTAKYVIEYKWYLGFNDEPFGDDYDYSKCEELKTWVTGVDSEKYDY